MKPMNDLLADIVVASGGTVTSNTRNGLLGDWLDAVSSPSLSPTITLNPVSQSVDEYGNVTFTGAATGDEPITYQWYKNGSPVGTDSTSYTLTAAAADNGATVYFTATNASGSATSSSATLTVISYAYRYGGVSMYSALSSELSVSSDFELKINATVLETGKIHAMFGTDSATKTGYFEWNSSSKFVLRVDGAWVEMPTTFTKTIGTHVIRIFRISNTYYGSLNGGSMAPFGVTSATPFYLAFIGRGFTSSAYRYMDGYIDSVKMWAGGNSSTGNLVFDNHLNNKSTGAAQAAVVGPSATIVNYNAANWVTV